MKISPEIARALSAVSCTECDQPFRLPTNASEIEVIECPHCGQNLDMETLLANIAEEMNIPTAGVVKAKEQASAPATHPGEDSVVVDPAGKQTHSFDEQDYVIPKPLKTAERRRKPSAKSVRKHKKAEKDRQFAKKKAGATEWLRILLGALLAIPVAQIVLWWVIKIDPFEVAPKVAEYVPFVVPAKWRPETDVETPETGREDMPDGQRMKDKNFVPVPLKYSPKTKN